MPSTVTIPADQGTTFVVSAVNDATPELDQSVTVTASAARFRTGTASISVVDNDLPTLSLKLPDSSLSEGLGPWPCRRLSAVPCQPTMS